MFSGSSDATYWNAVLGNINARPDTNGISFDLAYVPYPYGGPDLWPWLNARIGILYTHFNKFEGSERSMTARSDTEPRTTTRSSSTAGSISNAIKFPLVPLGL